MSITTTNVNGNFKTIPFLSDDSYDTSSYDSFRKCDGFKAYAKDGTTSSAGYFSLNLGNTIASGSTGNMRGQVRFYTRGSGYINLRPLDNSTGSSTYNINLPSANGTIALTSSANSTSSFSMGDGSKAGNGTVLTINTDKNTLSSKDSETTYYLFDIEWDINGAIVFSRHCVTEGDGIYSYATLRYGVKSDDYYTAKVSINRATNAVINVEMYNSKGDIIAIDAKSGISVRNIYASESNNHDTLMKLAKNNGNNEED